ncbi:asialoglycoprotein receptor-like 1 isoform X1 [Pseudochaenichthys georgianus]|uniref:asialoglycoprotein receptor-like 1 isoform X1 n=1 Tax=Pseudochaenichthys georgianus TaxID=52239 RepID=UPI00146F8EE2|nr:asialoglycoprotein receptor-like 1 isoform X1 [Pseudochaenichthys georgianus]
MESQYHQFGSSGNSPVHGETQMTAQTVSQLNKEVTDVKLNLKRIINGGAPLSPNSDEATEQEASLPTLVPVRGKHCLKSDFSGFEIRLIFMKPGACREGWVSYERICYKISTNSLTWSKAEDQCRAQEGHLVVLNTAEELDYISKVVEIRYNYWIGLVERENEGHWSWVDGTDINFLG